MKKLVSDLTSYLDRKQDKQFVRPATGYTRQILHDRQDLGKALTCIPSSLYLQRIDVCPIDLKAVGQEVRTSLTSLVIQS